MTGIVKIQRVIPLVGLDEEAAAFARVDPGEEFDQSSEAVIMMGLDLFGDLGRPTTITVTIEPGDTLNSEEST